MPMCSRSSLMLVLGSLTSVSSNQISPPVASSRRLTQRSSVDLPEPEGPRIDNDLALHDVDVHVLEDLEVTEALAQISDANDGLGHCYRPPSLSLGSGPEQTDRSRQRLLGSFPRFGRPPSRYLPALGDREMALQLPDVVDERDRDEQVVDRRPRRTASGCPYATRWSSRGTSAR